jgi:hypothetical protein
VVLAQKKTELQRLQWQKTALELDCEPELELAEMLMGVLNKAQLHAETCGPVPASCGGLGEDREKKEGTTTTTEEGEKKEKESNDGEYWLGMSKSEVGTLTEVGEHLLKNPFLREEVLSLPLMFRFMPHLSYEGILLTATTYNV